MQPWRAALALFLILPAAFAAGTDLAGLVPIVALTVLIFLALVNMLAAAISNPQLEAWAKTELREFLAGVILIALVIAFFIGSSGISVAFLGEGDYVKNASDRIDVWTGNLITSYENIIEAAGRIRVAATYSSGTNIPIYWISLSYQTAPLGGATIFLVPLSLATQGLTNAIFLCEGIRMLLAFFSVVMPKIMLPLAFSARLIPFTRKLGNTLVALALAAMIFFPLSVIFADMMNGQIYPEGMPAPAIEDLGKLDADPYPIYVFATMCEFVVFRVLFSMTDMLFALIVCLPIAWIPGAFPACYSLVWQVIYPIISMVFQIINGLMLIVWEAAVNPSSYGGDVFDQLRPFLRDMTNLVMVILLDIALISIITVSGMRSLSAALGGEWYMAGIQRLI